MAESGAQRPPKREKKFSKSLGSLLRFMEGIEIIVELKNGKRHRGILESCDEYMNLSLDQRQVEESSAITSGREPATSTAKSTPTTTSTAKQDYSSSSSAVASLLPPTPAVLELDDNILSSIDIRGANIRYIQFPDNADLTNIIKSGVERERAASKKYTRGKRK